MRRRARAWCIRARLLRSPAECIKDTVHGEPGRETMCPTTMLEVCGVMKLCSGTPAVREVSFAARAGADLITS